MDFGTGICNDQGNGHSSAQWHWGNTHILFPLSWFRSSRFVLTKKWHWDDQNIFRNKYTDQFFYLFSGERGKLNFSILYVVLEGAGILITCVRTSINKLQDKGKKGRKKPNNCLAQKALLRLHSKCFYNINNKSNFTAWWLKWHSCMEQLLKQTKSRFSHGGQPTLITGAVQSCRVEDGTEHFIPGSRFC